MADGIEIALGEIGFEQKPRHFAKQGRVGTQTRLDYGLQRAMSVAVAQLAVHRR